MQDAKVLEDIERLQHTLKNCLKDENSFLLFNYKLRSMQFTVSLWKEKKDNEVLLHTKNVHGQILHKHDQVKSYKEK